MTIKKKTKSTAQKKAIKKNYAIKSKSSAYKRAKKTLKRLRSRN